MKRIIWCSIPVAVFGLGFVWCVRKAIETSSLMRANDAVLVRLGHGDWTSALDPYAGVPCCLVCLGFLIIWLARLGEAIQREKLR